MICTNDQLKALLVGASISSSGGGGSIETALELLAASGIEEIEIISPQACTGTAITTYGVGSTTATVDDEIAQIKTLLDTYTATHETPDAIYPSECGPLAVLDALIAAAYLDVPVLDCDAADGRCVPLVQMGPLPASKKTSVIAQDTTTTLSVTEPLQTLETTLEKQIDGQIMFVAGQPYTCDQLCNLLKENTLTHALSRADGLDEAPLIEGTVTAVTELADGRFYQAQVTIDDTVTLSIVNEYIKIDRNEGPTITPPAHILVTDPATGHGVPSDTVTEGSTVAIRVNEPSGYWATTAGKHAYDNILDEITAL